MGLPEIQRFDTSTGVRIYRIPCQAFSRLVVHCFVLIGAGPVTLVDCGSGRPACTADLLEGLDSLCTRFGEAISAAKIERLLLTHGHIDHVGGVADVLKHAAPQIAMHPLDAHAVRHPREYLTMARVTVRRLLTTAGVPTQRNSELLKALQSSDPSPPGAKIDLALADGQVLDCVKLHHVPGHAPGQVCLELGDVLLTADHILPHTTPHQSPESLWPYLGIGHYLESLEKVRSIPGIRLALGSHEEPMPDVYARIGQIVDSQCRRLERARKLLAQSAAGLTAYELVQQFFPRSEGFNALLALEDVAARLEYLFERGEAVLANLDEVDQNPSTAWRYKLAD